PGIFCMKNQPTFRLGLSRAFKSHRSICSAATFSILIMSPWGPQVLADGSADFVPAGTALVQIPATGALPPGPDAQWSVKEAHLPGISVSTTATADSLLGDPRAVRANYAAPLLQFTDAGGVHGPIGLPFSEPWSSFKLEPTIHDNFALAADAWIDID